MTSVHDTKSPLSPDFGAAKLADVLFDQKAKLMFVSLNRAPHLLQRTPNADALLKSLLFHLCEKGLHPKGTVVVSMPTPWFNHAGHIAGKDQGCLYWLPP